MLWKTHLRITNEVMRRLRIPLKPEENSFLNEGVLAPDKWKNYPHHHGKSSEIRQHLMEARRFFLYGDMQKAYYNLGIALHYIQDSYTSFASFYPKHQSWEQSIDNSYMVSDVESTIQNYVRNSFQRDRCMRFAQELSREVQGRDNTLRIATLNGQEDHKSWANPKVDYNLGFRASFAVAKSVLSPKNCPELESALSSKLREYEAHLQSSEVSFSQLLEKMVKDRNSLEAKIIRGPGIVRKIKNWFFSISLKMANQGINRRIKEYDSQGHLHRVLTDYGNATNTLVYPHQGWYSFEIPKLNFVVVKKEILSLDEISRKLGLEKDNFKALLKSCGTPWLNIEGRELVRRSALLEVSMRYYPTRPIESQI